MKGISPEVISRSLGGLSPDPDILAGVQQQPEFIKPIWDYLDATVSERRINTGRSKLAEWSQVLDAVEKAYGVDRHIVLAIWGIESSYGAVLEDSAIVKPVIRSLASLACGDPKRAGFWREQLLAALLILDGGEITPDRMTGSWAGAMGHTQFIPTSFEAYAVDFTGDGRRDIWGEDPSDALASTAAYLGRHGWRRGEPWGVQVVVPEGVGGGRRSAREWAALGVRTVDGGAPPDYGPAALTRPDGAAGPAFLTFRNFDVIKRYNNADSYAIAVGHLSDRLRGLPRLQGVFSGERPLTLPERVELQERLTALGFDTNGTDGNVGPGTIQAIRAFQGSRGLPQTGFAEPSLLQALR